MQIFFGDKNIANKSDILMQNLRNYFHNAKVPTVQNIKLYFQKDKFFSKVLRKIFCLQSSLYLLCLNQLKFKIISMSD